MNLVNIAGFIALFTSIIGLFPQVYKAVKTRSTDDISMLMLVNFLICSLAWIIYGTYTHSLFVQLSNILGLASCLILILQKAHYDRQKKL